jgi:hypothetical protein
MRINFKNGFLTQVVAMAIFGFSLHIANAQIKNPTRPLEYDRSAFENAYVKVSRDISPCAQATVGQCEDRVVLAMGELSVTNGTNKKLLKRGQIAVFKTGESYEITQGSPFYEIAIKPSRPPIKSPPEIILPPKNMILYQGQKFFVYEEKLGVGDTRPRHSHSQRVEIRLSNGPMLHQWVWQGDKVSENEPSRVNWREPIIHEVTNIGDAPLSNFIMEFLPE